MNVASFGPFAQRAWVCLSTCKNFSITELDRGVSVTELLATHAGLIMTRDGSELFMTHVVGFDFNCLRKIFELVTADMEKL